MKVIELLNLISRDRELPNKIKYNGYIFEYDTNHKRYEAYFDEQIWTLQDFINVNDDLNNEVEIIEEHKIPEKLPEWATRREDKEYTNQEHHILVVARKVDEILDYLEEIE